MISNAVASKVAEAKVGESSDEPRDSDFRFHASQRCPEAVVRSRGEREVTVGVRPAEDQPIGLWKHLRVAVSGAEASDHDLAVMHLHRLPLGISVGDRLERRSNGLLDGAVIAEQL